MASDKTKMINIPRIQVFRPSLEEMKDFEGYINKIEASGAHKAGLAKIIPPAEWKPRRKDPDYQSDKIDSLVIKAPIQQVVQGRLGLYQQYNIQKKSLTVKEFKKLAESTKYRTPEYFDYEELERRYWKNVAYNPPIYGADVPGSLYDDDVDEFNINRLNTILDMVNESYGIKIMGVNTAYLYFGMWKTTFAWHTEDMDLHSINYLHFGAPKSWYCVPPEHGRRLERLAAGFFPTSVTSCPAFLRHKMTLISPAVLKQYSIPYNKITQEAGEFMVTFPYSYHAGYNHGYNCAESTNFATVRWVEYGKRATRCNCRSDSVKISMEAFVKKYQPDRYDLWLQGKDIGPHPEDPTHISPAPLPSDYELEVLSKVSKSKRHPPYKPEPETSDTESVDNNNHHNNNNNITKINNCEQVSLVMSAFPTKAALKHFENPGPSSSHLQQLIQKHGFGEDVLSSIGSMDQSYLKTSPPDLKDAVKRMRDRFAPIKSAPNKRSRKSSTASATVSIAPKTEPLSNGITNNHYNNNTTNNNTQYPRTPNTMNPNTIETSSISMCTQPAHSLVPLTWTPKSGHDPGALQLIDKFLNCDLKPLSMFSPVTPPQLQSPTNYYNNNNASNHHHHQNTSGLVNNYFHPSDQPHPPTGPTTYTYHQPEPHHATVEPSVYYHSQEDDDDDDDEKPTDLSTYFHHTDEHTTTITASDPFHQPRSSTSTQDLTVKNKKTPSGDLFKLLYDEETSSRDFRSLLKRVPVQSYLYQHLPYNYFGEQVYNCCVSSVFPYCSICSLMLRVPIPEDWVEIQSQIPSSSPILLPRATFASRLKVIDEKKMFEDLGPHFKLNEKDISPLLVCSDCKVCVHSICYGITDTLEIDRDNWLCDRCKDKDYGTHCCLCPLRGGALKKTTEEDKWVHLTCALVQPGVLFKDENTIDVSGIKSEWRNSRFKCLYCQKEFPKLVDYIEGFLIQCYAAPRCSSKFHTTCAYLNGAKFDMDDWPDTVRVWCTRCIGKTSEDKNFAITSQDEVALGTVVLAKHKNRRYYEAVIVDKMSMVLHHAHLDDNSILQSLKTSDILEPDIEKDGVPEVGETIKITWEKVTQYGKYAGNHTFIQYTVRFDDGWVNKMINRNTFYRLDEEIPNKVQAKRSKATEVTIQSFWPNNLKTKVMKTSH